ncbi:hypothetical protein HaLaN_32995, partial [Haematococcus lacustris]
PGGLARWCGGWQCQPETPSPDPEQVPASEGQLGLRACQPDLRAGQPRIRSGAGPGAKVALGELLPAATRNKWGGCAGAANRLSLDMWCCLVSVPTCSSAWVHGLAQPGGKAGFVVESSQAANPVARQAAAGAAASWPAPGWPVEQQRRAGSRSACPASTGAQRKAPLWLPFSP